MERREKYSKILIILFLISTVWILLQFLAPLTMTAGSVEDLTGLTAIEDNEEKIEEMSFPWNIIYSCGDRMCHQKASRSFFLNGNQMPFCARCTAIWAGVAIGLGFMLFYRIPLDTRFLFLIAIAIIPIGVDGVGQLLNFWES
ncbi:MAG: DUF2085 domain-containing protein, partial [Candidatus Thermoplasmatota archaeon]